VRQTYPEYFDRSDDDVQRFIKNAAIVLDAGVLLGLYRLSADAREDALSVLEATVVSHRLWVPYQVGKEFLENRPGVIGDLSKAYVTATSAVRNAAKQALLPFGEGRRFEGSRARVKAVVEETVDRLCSELSLIEGSDPSRIDPQNDALLLRIEELTAGRIGTRPGDAVLRERIETFFSYRLPHQIPPGYEDQKKSGVRPAGDYLVWCEILQKAEGLETPLLFVTEDTKSDWFEKERGQSTGPRRELVAEFAQRSSHGYHQVSFERFLLLSREHLSLNVEEKTLAEVAEDAEAASAAALREQIAMTAGRVDLSESWRNAADLGRFSGLGLGESLAGAAGLTSLSELAREATGLGRTSGLGLGESLAGAAGLTSLSELAREATGLGGTSGLGLGESLAGAAGLTSLSELAREATGLGRISGLGLGESLAGAAGLTSLSELASEATGLSRISGLGLSDEAASREADQTDTEDDLDEGSGVD